MSLPATLPKTQYTTFKFHSADGLIYSLKIGYEYNENTPECIENQLLRSVEYKDSQTKNAYLGSYLGSYLEPVLPSFSTLYRTTTGVRIYTKDNGVIAHDIFEDNSDLATLVDVQSLPPNVLCVKRKIFDPEPLT